MSLTKNRTIVMSKKTTIFLLIISLSLIFFIFISYITSEYNLTPWMLEKVDKRILVPPEFLNGDTIMIGDDIEYVRSKMKLYRNWAPTVFGVDSSSSYYTKGNISTAYFNIDDELNKLILTIYNRDSIAPNIFFAQTAKTLIKYYGESCKIYQYSNDTNIRILRWQFSSKSTISMSGSISESLSLSPKSYYSYFIVRITYNGGLGDSDEKMKHESLQELGIK